jgi:6-phosphofructokinase 1
VTIAVLTSGGDAPGMNAAIAGLAEAGARLGHRLLAVRGGFRGLADARIQALHADDARREQARSGTWLGSSRFPELASGDGLERCVEALDGAALAILGGGGSLEGARRLAAEGVPVAFIPATIDGDVAGSVLTLGMDSAVDYAVGVIDQLRVTGRSLPGRGFVLQTLGGSTGHLALAVAAAASLDDVIVPERPFDFDPVRFAERAGDGEAIVVLSEGAGNAVEVAADLALRSGVRVHPTILGHAQRAAAPTALDRRLGLAGGRAAAELLAAGHSVFVAFAGDGAPVPHQLFAAERIV